MILSISLSLIMTYDLLPLIPSEIEVMRGPMRLIIEVLRIIEYECVPHILREIDTIEVVVPHAPFRDHVETQEFVTQDHLDTLVKGRTETWRVRARYLGHTVLKVGL